MRLPEVRAFVDQHYEVVTVDVGRFDRNLQVPERYGVSDLEGVPALLIVDEGGQLRNRKELINVTDDRHKRPQQMVDWLAKWTR